MTSSELAGLFLCGVFLAQCRTCQEASRIADATERTADAAEKVVRHLEAQKQQQQPATPALPGPWEPTK